MPTRFEEANHLFSSIQSIATTLAIIVGGGWAYYEFWYKRETYPKLEVTHNVSFMRISEEECLVMTRIGVKNAGSTLINLDNYKTWLQRVYPLDKQIENKVKDGTDIVDAKRGHVIWPLISERTGDQVILEPGEGDTVYQDFLASTPLEIVRLSTHFPKEDGQGVWQSASLHILKEGDRKCS
jgi:hypothetical protein